MTVLCLLVFAVDCLFVQKCEPAFKNGDLVIRQCFGIDTEGV